MSLKHDATWTLIDTWIKSLEDASPINILFLTHPISTSITSRIKSLELLYTKSSLYRFLLKKGVYPLLLFTTVSGGIGYGLQRTYTRSTKLVLNLLGVLYPTWACWKLIKQRASEKGEQEEEQLKSWLTYWMIFGSFQVLDHWMESDLLFSKKKYNLYKLFILYWAQNPHSNGAQLLYRHVIQKPPVNKTKKKDLVETSLEKKKEKKKEQESSIILFQQEEEEEEEEHTITITGAATATATTAYSYLDGYHPPSLPLVEHITHSSSSDDDDSIHSQPQQSNNTILIPSSTTTTTQQEKETFLPLSYTIETTTSTIESAW